MTDRCSVLSAARDESMLGTGFAESGLLLVEVPGAWGREAPIDPAWQDRAAAENLRLLAIRSLHGDVPDEPRWAIRPAGSSVVRWSTGETDAEPLYLVCTHAKRDQCCAVYGREVALALEQRRPGRVWGCSHTGGHRFAPVVLTLPNGALYGRVGTDVLDKLVEATERGEVLPEHLRGELGHPPAVQAALAYARMHTGEAGPLTVGGVDSDGRFTSVRIGGYEVTVEARREAVPFPSCGKPDPKTETSYVPISITR